MLFRCGLSLQYFYTPGYVNRRAVKPRTMKKLKNGVKNEFQAKIEPPYLKDHILGL